MTTEQEYLAAKDRLIDSNKAHNDIWEVDKDISLTRLAQLEWLWVECQDMEANTFPIIAKQFAAQIHNIYIGICDET